MQLASKLDPILNNSSDERRERNKIFNGLQQNGKRNYGLQRDEAKCDSENTRKNSGNIQQLAKFSIASRQPGKTNENNGPYEEDKELQEKETVPKVSKELRSNANEVMEEMQEQSQPRKDNYANRKLLKESFQRVHREMVVKRTKENLKELKKKLEVLQQLQPMKQRLPEAKETSVIENQKSLLWQQVRSRIFLAHQKQLPQIKTPIDGQHKSATSKDQQLPVEVNLFENHEEETNPLVTNSKKLSPVMLPTKHYQHEQEVPDLHNETVILEQDQEIEILEQDLPMLPSQVSLKASKASQSLPLTSQNKNEFLDRQQEQALLRKLIESGNQTQQDARTNLRKSLLMRQLQRAYHDQEKGKLSLQLKQIEEEQRTQGHLQHVLHKLQERKKLYTKLILSDKKAQNSKIGSQEVEILNQEKYSNGYEKTNAQFYVKQLTKRTRSAVAEFEPENQQNKM